MKQKIPKIKCFLFILFMICLNSCQDDDYKHDLENNNNQIYKHVSIDELPQIKPLLSAMKKLSLIQTFQINHPKAIWG